MTAEQKASFWVMLKAEPRRFIAQEVIDFQDLDILEDGKQIPRKADLRAFVLMAEYVDFGKNIDIPNIYEGKEDFVEKYPFDPSNPDSIISNLNRAYDNAIVLRESIGSECLAYIQLAIYEMNHAAKGREPCLFLATRIECAVRLG